MRTPYLILAAILLLLLILPAGRRLLGRLIPDYQPHSALHYLFGLEYWQHGAHIIRLHVIWGMLVWSVPFRAKYYGGAA